MKPTRMTGLAAAVGILAMLLGRVASGQNTMEACHDACDAQNIPTSCAWLTRRPGQCLGHAIHDCRQGARQGGPAACNPPRDLPACLTNHGCPFGSLCIGATCQVAACSDGCPGTTRCDGQQCVMDDCQGADENCPSGFHCVPGSGVVSATCEADDPTRTACSWDTDCIALGNLNPRCLNGVCGAVLRRRACTLDKDCFRACSLTAASIRLSHCNAAGQCACANCADAEECSARYHCTGGTAEECRINGTCFCPPLPPPPPSPPTTMPPDGGSTGFCTTFDNPPCTPCRTQADCGGFDACLHASSCG